MQRGVPGFGRVRVRALLEQVDRERRVATVGRHDQRAGAGGRGVIHVATTRHQVCRRVQIALSGGKQHRRIPALHDVEDSHRVEARGPRVDSPGQGVRSRVDIGPEFNQCRHDVRVLLRHRPHQCGLSSRLFLRVDDGAVGHEEANRLGGPGAGRGHQHRLA